MLNVGFPRFSVSQIRMWWPEELPLSGVRQGFFAGLPFEAPSGFERMRQVQYVVYSRRLLTRSPNEPYIDDINIVVPSLAVFADFALSTIWSEILPMTCTNSR